VPWIEPFIGLALNMWVETFKRVLPTTPDWVSLTLFWVLPPLMLVGLGVYLDRFFRRPRRTVWRIAVPCFLTALCTLFLSSTIPSASAQIEGAKQVVQSGQGGSGGSMGSISGERLDIDLGKGGAGGCGGVGGAGGSGGDVHGNDARVHTGQGGDAAPCDGLGANRTPSPAELDNWPSQSWRYGYGGRTADTPIGKYRIEVLTRIRREYMDAFPEDVSHIDAGVLQVPINWVNKRLEELNETWRVTEGKDGYVLPRLDNESAHPVPLPPKPPSRR
jgi:hypothetical protein